MKQLTDILYEVAKIIEHYESGAFLNQEALLKASRELSSNNYWLTVHYIEFKRRYNELIYTRPMINNKRESVSSAENRADKQYPELHQCKHILDAIKNVSISMNYEIQLMK